MKSLLRKVLPSSVKRGLSRSLANLKAWWLMMASRSLVMLVPSYLLNPLFLADFRAFASGATAFRNKEKRATGANLSRLRRDIHRVEKGMSFPNPRKSFALDYIGDAVDQFQRLKAEDGGTARSEFDWARDVLIRYFDMTESDAPRYVAAQRAFQSTIETARPREVPGPYQNQSTPQMQEALLSLLDQRKSVRRYLPEPIPQEALDAALSAAARAPSSCNRQPYQYYILNTPETAQKAARISAGTAGWVHEIPCLAVLVGDASYFANGVNRHSIYVDSTLSVMPFVLSLEAQGFSTCLINWADDHARRSQMAKLLGLRDYQRVIISIAIGVADTDCVAPFSKRKYAREIRQDV